MRHEPIYYGSQDIVECSKCDTAWPCVYEQGWRDGLREAADEIRAERRWQVEKARTGVQSIHNYCDGRLAVVEQILLARADAEEGK